MAEAVDPVDPVALVAAAAMEIAGARDEAHLIEISIRVLEAASGADRCLVVLPGSGSPPSLPRQVMAMGMSMHVTHVLAIELGLEPEHPPLAFVLVTPIGATGWLALIADRLLDRRAEPIARTLAVQIAAAADRVRSAQLVHSAQTMYRTLVEQIPAIIYYRSLDTPGIPSFVSPQIRSILGYTPEEATSDPAWWRDRIHPEDRERLLRQQREFRPAAVDRPVCEQYRFARSDGTYAWMKNYALSVRDEQGSARFLMGVLFDETDTKRTEAKLDHLSEANVIGLMTADLRGMVLEANDCFLRMVGRTRDDLEAKKISWQEMTPPESRARDAKAVEQLLTKGVAEAWEKEYVLPDGSRVPVLMACAMAPGSVDECISWVVDLSEQKRLEQQLWQSQKMEAVGRLAGGIAHDFNNILSVILSYGSLIDEALPAADPMREDVQEIIRAGSRARDLTRQLLAFSRQQVRQPKLLHLGASLRALEVVLRPLLGGEIELVTRAPPSTGAVIADAGQIDLLIMNLAMNARDAMPQGGVLTIEIADVQLDESFAATHVGVVPGDYLMLSISDTGLGMDDATRARVFEPFFTTKPKGKVAGLGLATVFGIVQQSGGTIWVRSEPGAGAAFEIYLPRAEAPTVAAGARESNGAEAVRGSETVLLAEDDDQVRKLARSILLRCGYQVLEAADGGEALAISNRHTGEIDILVTDVVMPHMNGRELAERLAPIRPSMKVMYMSGYTDDTLLRHRLLTQDVLVMQKPFTGEELARFVRSVLDRAGHESSQTVP